MFTTPSELRSHALNIPDNKFKEAVRRTPLRAAVTIAVWPVEIVPAVPGKVALLEPEGTNTVVGTMSAGILLESVMVTPPEPATWDKVAVHVDVAPELILLGVHANEVKVGMPD